MKAYRYSILLILLLASSLISLSAQNLGITNVSTDPTSCSDGTDGIISFEIVGGSAPYTWSILWGIFEVDGGGPTGVTSITSNGRRKSDIFTIGVQDNDENVAWVSVTVDGPDSMLITSYGSTDLTCNNDNSGSITVTATGESGSHLFDLSGPVTINNSPTGTFNNLPGGTYTVTAKDGGGCTSTDVTPAIIINNPDPVDLNVDLVTNVVCNGEATGAIGITPTGGTPGYTYLWTGPNGFTALTQDISGLAAGPYNLTLTDANDCKRDYFPLLTIAENDLIIGTFAIINLNCGMPLPSNDGAIDATIQGGSSTYTYSWTGPNGFTASTQDISGLVAGSYILEVTDDLGCAETLAPQTVSMPAELIATATQIDNTCFGYADGAIDLTVAGGTAPYTYAWTGPSGYTGTTQDISGLEAGAYSVTITYSGGCSVPFNNISIITEPPEIQVNSVKTDISCGGLSDGTINITASGGQIPYTYSINGGTDFYTTNLFTGLAPGNYQTVVMDATGCSVPGNLNVLVEPAPFQITLYIQDDITSCFDSEEGRIQIIGVGGTGTISYSLNGDPPVSTGDFQNLPGGPHVVTMIDGNACTHDTSVVILTPPVLSIDNITITDVTVCAGNTNGALDVTGSGGTGLLEFSLDDVSYLPDTFDSLGAGDYTVWLKDANGCTVNAQASITEPVPVLATVVKTDVSYGSLGSITISNVTGGTAPYEYSINGLSGPFTDTTSYTDLVPATYHVIVRDQDGCRDEEMVVILDVLPLDVVVYDTAVSCFGASDGRIEFVPQDAEGAVQYSIDNGANFQSDPLFTNLPGNITYQLVALDAAGKLYTDAVILTEPAEILFSYIMDSAQCNAFSATGAIDITVSGGAGSFTYLWSDGSTQEDRSNILAGVYNLLITDGNNCPRNEIITVSSEVTVNVDAGADASICAGASVQLQGAGVGTPSWDLSPFLSDETILDPVASGMTSTNTFVLTITETDSPYDCYNKDSVTVIQHPLMDLEVIEDTFVIEGHSIRLETTGGPFDQYRWEPETGLDNSSVPDPVATPMVPTQYTVFAINSYGCEEVDGVFIDVIEDIQAYNAFSPNGDGINEYFEIKNAERFPEILVEVYSRWGDQLYSKVGYDSGELWDGTTGGKEVPVGTYYYILVPYPGAKPISGNVTIIR